MKVASKLLLLATSLLAGTVSVSGRALASDPVFIKSLNFLGSGCTNNDSISQLDDTNNDGLPDQFTIFFSNYIAFSGPGSTPLDWRKNCNINVGLHLPQGFQFSIADVHYTGFAQLPYGVSATQQSTYQFVFFSRPITLSTTQKGKFEGNYDLYDTLGLASLVWSPCGADAPLNIRSQLFLSGALTYPAQVTTDQIDGRVKQVFQFKWRKCNAALQGAAAR